MNISVIVPFLNEEKNIRACAESLLRQDYDAKEYELLFIDNGSVDRSVDIVREYPQIRLFKEPRVNAYLARNRGISEARGDVLAFIDADCVAAPDWLKQIEAAILEKQARLLVGSRQLAVEKGMSLRFIQQYENSKTEYVYNQPETRYFFAYTNNMAVLAQDLRELKGFRPLATTGDTDFIQRFVSNFGRKTVCYEPKMRVRHQEIEHIRVWLKKQVIRGRDNDLVSRMTDYRPLPGRAKWRIFYQCRSKFGYSFTHTLCSLTLLMIGNIYYMAGNKLSFRT